MRKGQRADPTPFSRTPKNGTTEKNTGREGLVNGGRRCTVLDGLEPGGVAGLLGPESQAGNESRPSTSSSDGSSSIEPAPVQKQKSTQRSSIERLHRGGFRGEEFVDEDPLATVKRLSLTLPPISSATRRSHMTMGGSAREAKTTKLPALRFVEHRQDFSPLLQELKDGKAGRSPKYTAQEKRLLSRKEGSSPDKTSRQRFRDHTELFSEISGDTPHRKRASLSLVSPRRTLGEHAVKLQPIGIIPDSAVTALFEADSQYLKCKEDGRASRSGKLKAPSSGEAGDFDDSQRVNRGSSKFTSNAVDSEANLEDTGHDSPTGWHGQAASVRKTKREGGRGSVLTEVSLSQGITLDRRHACEAMRMFVFGKVGNEGLTKHKEKSMCYYEGMGTKRQVSELFKFWCQLDMEGAGRTDLADFQAYYLTCPKDKREHADKFFPVLMGLGSSFTLEDLMRIIWPGSTQYQLQEMMTYIEECRQSEKLRVAHLPVINAEDHEALVRTFRHIDSNDDRRILFTDLADSGLVDEDTAADYCHQWDVDGDGALGHNEFLVIMCPSGYRASEEVNLAYDLRGQLILRNKTGVWHQCNSSPKEALRELRAERAGKS